MQSSPTLIPIELSYAGPAEAVRLRTFMPRFPSPLDFEPRAGGWGLTLELPVDGRIEYRLEVEDGHGRIHSILDPTNSRRASNPFGENSVWSGPAYDRPDWLHAPPERGHLAEIRVRSDHLGGRRHHVLYSPADLAPSVPAPLLVCHDGSDYVGYAGLLRCVDALVDAAAIPPIRVVGLNPRVRHERYIASDAHADHVVDEVLPHVRDRVEVAGRPVLMGASLGAVAAWHTAWRHQDQFSGLVLQSGTFALSPHPELDGPMYTSINQFVEAALDDPRVQGMSVYQSCGRWESLIDWNRAVARVLNQAAHRHRYVETWTGHDWGAWSGTMAEGLEQVFAPRTREL